MSAVVHYLSRRYSFTAVCIRTDEGNYEATLTRRTPGLVQRGGQRPPQAEKEEAEEHFISTSESGALNACKERIRELGGEILGEIATEQYDDWPGS
jgi:hypothetical protein